MESRLKGVVKDVRKFGAGRALMSHSEAALLLHCIIHS